MSFQFGQFRRSQVEDYLIPLTYSLDDLRFPSTSSASIIFKDKIISLEGKNILKPTEADGLRARNYYIRFKILKSEIEQTIAIKLINTERTSKNDNSQTLKTIVIPAGKEGDFSIFEIVISPNNIYNQIRFEIQRNYDDYNIKNSDGTYGRVTNLEILRLDEVLNVINTLSGEIDGRSKLLQIGVQGMPGLTMCINGEEIRIGRSGIYEINNGYRINFIGFIVEPNDNKNFMLDYQY